LIKKLEEKNINEISIRDLCNDAGVGRASFYRHFNSKEEVLQVHAYKLICEWGDTLERDTNAKPSAVFEILFQHVVDHGSFYKLLYKMNMADMILKIIKKKYSLMILCLILMPMENHFLPTDCMAGLMSGYKEEWMNLHNN
jgi:AcrR family transcriptional regulator